jgi:hypothetical protein
MSNNPYRIEIQPLIDNGDEEALRLRCEAYDVSRGCPCVGRDKGEMKLISTHPGYPDSFGPACITKISGEPLSTTEEYDGCLLASACQYFFPGKMTTKFDSICAHPRECDIPIYVGYGSGTVPNISSTW